MNMGNDIKESLANVYEGGKTPAQAVFDRLADIVCDGKRVKLIGLATSLSMPSGIDTTHVTITREEVSWLLFALSAPMLSFVPK